jgi:adenosine/AMP kinase
LNACPRRCTAVNLVSITDAQLGVLARTNAEAVAGHSLRALLRDCYPINVLPVIRQVPEVCGIYCATGNPVDVILAETATGRGILGFVDGARPKGVDTENDVTERKALLRRLSHKL